MAQKKAQPKRRLSPEETRKLFDWLHLLCAWGEHRSVTKKDPALSHFVKFLRGYKEPYYSAFLRLGKSRFLTPEQKQKFRELEDMLRELNRWRVMHHVKSTPARLKFLFVELENTGAEHGYSSDAFKEKMRICVPQFDAYVALRAAHSRAASSREREVLGKYLKRLIEPKKKNRKIMPR